MSDDAFPVNIVALFAEFVGALPMVTKVVLRPIHTDDPTGTVGIFAASWEPDDKNWMIGSPEPFATYRIGISTLIKNMTEETGRHDSSLLVKSLRVLLYRNPDLTLRLHQLSETSFDVIERATRVKVQRASFMDGTVQGQFAFCSVTHVAVSTEIT